MTVRLRLVGVVTPVALLLSSGLCHADGTKQQCADANQRGQDLRRDGKLSAARDALRSCAVPACPALVRDDCTKRLDELERAQPSVLFEATDGAGNDVSAVTVTIDGQPFADHLGGEPLAVDPGEHTFVFTRADQPPLQKKLVIREGEKGRLEKVTIGPVASPSGVAPAPATPDVGSSGAHGGFGASKALAVAAGVVGVAGLGLGSAFGLVAISKKNDAQSACPGVCASAGDASKWSDAKSAGNVSTVSFIVGGVALAAGVVLWVTAPSSTERTSAQVGVGPGSIQVAGTW